jgi:exosortase/archaeosortase family protein
MRVPRPKMLSKDQERLWKTLQFIVRFTLFSIPLYLILWLNVGMMPLQSLVAGHAAWAIDALGYGVSREGLFLSVGQASPFIFLISEDCTGWKSMLAFIALVISTLCVTFKKRALGIAIGIPLIYLGNLARILLVVVIEAAYGYEAALFFHDWLWQAGLIALVLVLWLAWLRSDYLFGSCRRRILSSLPRFR